MGCFLCLPVAITVLSATVVPVCPTQLHVLVWATSASHPRPSDCHFCVIDRAQECQAGICRAKCDSRRGEGDSWGIAGDGPVLLRACLRSSIGPACGDCSQPTAPKRRQGPLLET